MARLGKASPLMPHGRRHHRRAAQGNLRTLIQHAENEAKAAIEASGCARSIDRLGLASFYAGQVVGASRRSGSSRSSSIVELISKARRVVETRCEAQGRASGVAALSGRGARKPFKFQGRGKRAKRGRK